MLALLRYWQIGAGAALGAFLMFGVSAAILQPQARQEGRALERADANARAMRIIQERIQTNADVGKMSLSELCSELGGRMHDDGTCR